MRWYATGSRKCKEAISGSNEGASQGRRGSAAMARGRPVRWRCRIPVNVLVPLTFLVGGQFASHWSQDAEGNLIRGSAMT